MLGIHPVFLLIGAEALQLVTLVLQRQLGLSFWRVLPVVIAFMWLFMKAYTSNEWSFTVAWFVGTAICSIGSIALGIFWWKEVLTAQQWVGIALTLIGGLLLTIKIG